MNNTPTTKLEIPQVTIFLILIMAIGFFLGAIFTNDNITTINNTEDNLAECMAQEGDYYVINSANEFYSYNNSTIVKRNDFTSSKWKETCQVPDKQLFNNEINLK